MMSTTLSSLSTSISSGVAIPRQDSLNTRSVKKIAQVRQVRPYYYSWGTTWCKTAQNVPSHCHCPLLLVL